MTGASPPRRRLAAGVLATVVVTALLVLALVSFLRRDPLHEDAVRYEAVTRAFYVGLAALEAGLLDDARRHFERAAETAPGEPAIFANLGVTHLRLGDLDGAEEPIRRALDLSPADAGIALLAGRFETVRGRLDEGIAHLRRAVALAPDNLRARYALAEELERSGAPGAEDEAQAVVDAIVERQPDNLAAIVEQTRLAARRGDVERLREAAARLAPAASAWPPLARDQHQALQEAAARGDLDAAARASALLRNVLLAVPAFLESRVALQIDAGLMAEAVDRFLVLPTPLATPAPPDMALSFVREPVADAPEPLDRLTVAFLHDADERPAWLAAGGGSLRRIDAPGEWALPAPSGDASILALDWNNDFLMDLLVAGSDGVRLFVQGGGGTFADVTQAAASEGEVACDCVGAWPADVEMDGDIDVILAPRDGEPRVLRNRGDGSWDVVPMFPGVHGPRALAWSDLDQDADPDAAFVDAGGALHVFLNRQAGDFLRIGAPATASSLVALTAADANADGRIDLVALDTSGTIHRFSLRSDSSGRLDTLAWDEATVATWDGFADRWAALAPADREPGRHRLFLEDLDNNGALDLVATGPAATAIWLGDERHGFRPLPDVPGVEVFAVLDADGSGRLDLLGLDGGRPVRLRSEGTQAYHWASIRVRAQDVPGDQRINSMAIGGDIEVRSGLLTQKQVLRGTPAHFGLGVHNAIDVARIVWPNGVAQAEFELDADGTIVAEQRLKGSCPWVFAWDGSAMRFVTDFLWRSPLGLRINAQDTAGVAQTEDWILLRGDQLVPRDGMYDIRITAELWETHYFDHLSLLVVDAPADVEVFVDERFAPARPPALEVRAVRDLRAVPRARDGAGRDVTALVAQRDGQYLAAFTLGTYQGIAEEYVVEFEIDAPGSRTGRTLLVAHGWVYPTDSSINVAIGQGGHVRPQGVALEALDAHGRWQVVKPDVGFPAGKNKTMLIDLRAAGDATRLRLRTNLEISWDLLATAAPVEVPLRIVRLPARAELRYRGFSETISPRGAAPETPLYDRIATTGQRWRDLTGYYTRFGDVDELLAGIDDRYVIMNAGDELRLQFDEQPAPPDGWRRSFVLIGDGWEKDGDYNTRFSQTVLPLPSHDDPEYAGPLVALEHDPVYQRHRGDWERYHTRFVTPRAFARGLARAATTGDANGR